MRVVVLAAEVVILDDTLSIEYCGPDWQMRRSRIDRRDIPDRGGSMPNDPLVSCLMVTLPSPQRRAFVERAIAAYCAQTYPRRELVVVFDDGPAEAKAAIARHVAALGRDDIRLSEAPPGTTLGALRNLSCDAARGAVLCQWDDDDLHHPERVERQLDALLVSGTEASALSELMQFFPATRELYWTNWSASAVNVVPQAIIFRADAGLRYAEAGEKACLGEDLDFCERLMARGELSGLGGAPQLLVYVSHGANISSDEHHAMLARRLGLSRGLLQRREAWIRGEMARFDLGPGPVTVRGPNGAAFTLDR
jgi:glycosyltransferase involved in cell wall biosynthesis